MFELLRKRWKVGGWQFFLIFLTFGVTGSTTAWISKAITQWIAVDKYSFSWWSLKILVLLIGYQILILFFGFCFGQFTFFWNYEKKLLSRLGIRFSEKKMNKIAIFASGAGSNAQKIIDHFHSAGYGGVPARVVLIISGNPNAGVLKIAGKEGIRALILNKERFQADGYLSQLKDIDLIVLAGFLWKIPQKLVDAFPRRIINIHPALLPKFGGKGMYGHNVHNAVISQQEKETGITIHYVDEVYDNGEIIFQATCSIERSDDANEVARKVHELEHTYYPGVIESVLKVKSELKNNS